MEISLKGRKAIITGSTGQLGRTIARTLAGAGADIVIHYLQNEKKALELKEEITRLGVRSMTAQADVTCFDSVISMRDKIKSEFGDIDIVVDNAVIQYSWTTIIDQDLKDFQSQFDSCVMQNVHMAKAFIPSMKEKKFGKFIGINTECSALCNANSGAYASAKRGMDGIYRTLAKEVGKYNINVNQIAPGWTVSDRDRENNTEISPSYSANVPLGHRGTDIDIANAVLFFASPLSDFITGVYLPVCGGTVMPGI